MRRATALMGAALVFFATAASAQDKPNFSGKWTLDAEKTAAANPNAPQGGGPGGGRPGGPGGQGMGGPFSVTLDATSLTRESEGQNGPMKQVYKLDGSETEITMGQRSSKAKAKWEGSTLVIETTIETPNGSRVTKAVWALEGDYLVISNTRPGRDGAAMTTKQYYKKI